ncbi:hypothetical protein [Dactylosporangium sp. CA-139066]|uniref:hypothetical protein n=1 Tax=Dactylosporangium sp. CA-139066 TaxID=3239930 RepID=UPI003D8E5FA6
MGDGSVKVNPPDLLTYARDLVAVMADQQSQISEPVTAISTHSAGAFMKIVPGTPQFAEGRTAMAIVQRNLQDFGAFLRDVGTGIQAIQSAALAIGVAYATTDDESALGINAVDFAFAGTSGAPAGFPKNGYSTMSADQAKADAESGRYTEANQAIDDPDLLQYADKQPVEGGFKYTFPDGSMLMVTTANSGSMFISNNTTTTSVYKPGAKQPSSIVTTGESYDYSGQQTKSKTVQTLGADGKYTTSTSSTTQLSGGGVHVSSTSVGLDGKVQTTEQTVVPAKQDDKPDTGLTPTEERERQYGSHGSDSGKAIHGEN